MQLEKNELRNGRQRRNRAEIMIPALLLVVIFGCSKKPDLAGHWEGVLDVSSAKGAPGVPESGKLKVIFDIKKSDSTYAGTITSPDQNPQPINVDSVTLKEDSVSVQVNQLFVNFAGKMSKDGNEITGDFKQGPMSVPLTLKRLNVPGSLGD